MVFPEIRSLYKNNKTLFYLYLVFISLFLIKTLISLYFTSPFRLPDEVEYFTKAAAVFHTLNLFASPPMGNGFPGYPIVVSAFFGLSQSYLLIYHLILIFNAGLSALIIFPTYFILREYCSEKISLIGTVLVATLSNITVFSFSVMSEDIFIPLVIFSCWFLVDYYKNNSKISGYLFILSLVMLALSRPTGFVAILSFCLIIFFEKCSGLSNRRREISFGIFIAVCAVLGVLLSYLIMRNTLYLSGYDVSEFLKSALSSLGSCESVLRSLSLFLYQIEYLVLSGYCIFFLLAGLLFLALICPQWVTRSVKFEVKRNLDANQLRSLRAFGLYIFFISLSLVLITTLFLLPSSQQPVDIFGRYLDPIVPMLFIFGIVSISLLFEQTEKPGKYFFNIFTVIVLIISIVFMLTFPFNSGSNYVLVNILPIWYILMAKNSIQVVIFITILFVGSTALFLSGFYSDKMKYRFLAIMIILSVSVSAVAVSTELSLSSYEDSQNQMGKFLSENSHENTVTAIDLNSGGDPDYIWLSLFLTKGSVVTIRLSQKNGIPSALPSNNTDFLISSKPLAYPAVEFNNAAGGFNLYVTNVSSLALSPR